MTYRFHFFKFYLDKENIRIMIRIKMELFGIEYV